MTAVRTHTHAQAVDAAIELFSRKGYEQTTVEEIADAAQVSRATFFRRFRSKEDVIFADHELLLEEVVVMLAETRPEARASEEAARASERAWDPAVDPYLEVCRAARLVFDHHVGQRETSLARHKLLQQVPALRDRELVTTHRYERAFTAYLRDTLPPDRNMTTMSIAFAAAVVAVHNAILRRWLRNPHLDLRPELEEAFADLRRVATAPLPRSDSASDRLASPSAAPERLADPARPATGATASVRTAGTDGRRVVVAVLEPGAGPDDVARAVRDALA
ncbi:TetR/AcrR family transcriptional regulator [Isoptericola variabilis]|uniref:Regulatory protein TetR n=1 Tax=Isoptericola variabilis (strain 225) TaxID=743718 RepID=F6FUL9_ISOV2|nr:TetR/AcrR family transcriptional regulator [Isoptericola variabilis]AEG45446.1 regulatory protein TetR [Isoptericola variabilis 225]TWH31532.1 TetR family transcriptional regulator [Isoptericola variabilis J7]